MLTFDAIFMGLILQNAKTLPLIHEFVFCGANYKPTPYAEHYVDVSPCPMAGYLLGQ